MRRFPHGGSGTCHGIAARTWGEARLHARTPLGSSSRLVWKRPRARCFTAVRWDTKRWKWLCRATKSTSPRSSRGHHPQNLHRTYTEPTHARGALDSAFESTAEAHRGKKEKKKKRSSTATGRSSGRGEAESSRSSAGPTMTCSCALPPPHPRPRPFPPHPPLRPYATPLESRSHALPPCLPLSARRGEKEGVAAVLGHNGRPCGLSSRTVEAGSWPWCELAVTPWHQRVPWDSAVFCRLSTTKALFSLQNSGFKTLVTFSHFKVYHEASYIWTYLAFMAVELWEDSSTLSVSAPASCFSRMTSTLSIYSDCAFMCVKPP